jgi:hypothetical protein
VIILYVFMWIFIKKYIFFKQPNLISYILEISEFYII